jgi:hypothetical protein
LRQAFGIRADEVDVEQFVRIEMRRRGWNNGFLFVSGVW